MRVPTRKNREPELTPTAKPAAAKLLASAHTDELELPEPQPPANRPLPLVAIIGRPNVGKSTLFNRIVGRRQAIVHDRPGVTRDRNFAHAEYGGLDFMLVDTGGYDTELDDPLLESVVEQVRLAMDEADLIIFLAAVAETAHPADEEVIRRLRGVKKPVLVAVNKCDNPRAVNEANDFYRFGFDHVFPIAALHGTGVAEMLDAMVAELRSIELPLAARRLTGDSGIRLALVGRQNVGKSTLINQLAGEQRVIAAPLPGTTRDAIDTIVHTPEGKPFTLIDTAGIRRRGKIERGVEKLSVLSSMLSLERADVAAILIDGQQGLTEQDAHVAGFCVDAGLPTIIVVNKWDIVEKDHRTADQFTKTLEEEWAFLRYAPVLYISAKTGQRATRVFEVAERIYNNARRRIDTPELNQKLEDWALRKPPTMAKNRRPKVRFMTQTGIQPPTFTLFVNDPELFHFSYQRYIINRLRDAYDFEGTPIRLQLRRSSKSRPDDPKVKHQ
jgi:GTP-binding protein